MGEVGTYGKKPDVMVNIESEEHPNTAAYALRELADWIEHRTGGEEARDKTRIDFGREVADTVEEFSKVQQETIESLHQCIEELEDLRTLHTKLDTVITALNLSPDVFMGVDMANDPDVTTVVPFKVGDHKCSKLEFSRLTADRGMLRVTCELGRTTHIDLERLVAMADSREAVMEIARRIASEHKMDVGALFNELRQRSIGDLSEITVEISSSRTRPTG